VMEEVRPTYGSLLPTWVPTPRRVRLKRLLDRVDRHLYERIDDLLSGEATNDYLRGLSEADPELFDRDQLRDEYITIIAAGHRTTSTALTAGLGVLARNSDVADRLRADVDAILDSHGSLAEGIYAADVENRYLGGFIREVLRLYPPSPHIIRDAVTDVSIDDVVFPEGATVWMPQWVLHRDSRYWADPEAFRPERWLTGEAPKEDDSYLPFGAGPRRCLGQHLADVEMKLVFAEMVSRFELEPAETDSIEVAPSLTTVVLQGHDLLIQHR
jgi:cytochrome P450